MGGASDWTPRPESPYMQSLPRGACCSGSNTWEGIIHRQGTGGCAPGCSCWKGSREASFRKQAAWSPERDANTGNCQGAEETLCLSRLVGGRQIIPGLFTDVTHLLATQDPFPGRPPDRRQWAPAPGGVRCIVPTGVLDQPLRREQFCGDRATDRAGPDWTCAPNSCHTEVPALWPHTCPSCKQDFLQGSGEDAASTAPRSPRATRLPTASLRGSWPEDFLLDTQLAGSLQSQSSTNDC